MQVATCSWRMACCSLYPSSSSHIASRPYGHKLARKDWNTKFKKHLRMHQMTLFQDKKSKKYLAPPQTSPPVGRGIPPPQPQPPRRLV